MPLTMSEEREAEIRTLDPMLLIRLGCTRIITEVLTELDATREKLDAEREHCAKVAEEHLDHGEFSCGGGRHPECPEEIAAAIRSGK